MGSFEVFSNPSYFAITLAALLILGIAARFSSRDIKIGKGIWYLFIGIALEFLSSWLGYKTSEYYAQGISITFLISVELLLLLTSMVFLGLAASQLLVSSLPDVPIIALVTGLGLIAIVYFVFISPDGNMVASMRQIFPIAGFSYVAASFWSQSFRRNKHGYFLGALAATYITVALALRLYGIEYFISQGWYIPALSYVIFAIGLLMIKSDALNSMLEEAQLEIEKYNNRIEEIIKLSPFPIIISRLSDDKLILANNNAVKLFGIDASELERYRLKDFFADSDNRRMLNERLEQEREVQDFEILVKTPSGNTPFWLLTSANIIDYNYDIAIYAAFQDITSRKNREALLKNQAVRDPLTSLFNRRYFEEEVSKRIALSRMNGTNFSVLMIDADHFKRVNDTYGHKVGDKVLIELSSTCERALRDDDIVARYGGEEFVVYLAKVNAEKAKTVADRLRETISKIVVYSDLGEPINFTVSIGISSSEISDNIDTLIKTSDEALYRAKENGRNRCEIFTPEDLQHFNMNSLEHKDESLNRHPIFDKEETEEISLLDGIAANHIIDESTKIEQPRPASVSPVVQETRENVENIPVIGLESSSEEILSEAVAPVLEPVPESQPQTPSPAMVSPAPEEVLHSATVVRNAFQPVAGIMSEVDAPSPVQPSPKTEAPTTPQAVPQTVPAAPQSTPIAAAAPKTVSQPQAPQPVSPPQTASAKKEEEYFPILGIDSDDL